MVINIYIQISNSYINILILPLIYIIYKYKYKYTADIIFKTTILVQEHQIRTFSTNLSSRYWIASILLIFTAILNIKIYEIANNIYWNVT